MNVQIDHVTPERIVMRLRDGATDTVITGWHTDRAVTSLVAALDVVTGGDGYAECFWPEPTGQYWWMFNREGRRLEVVVLWSRGAVTGWQHVFRAADEVGYLVDRIRDEMAARNLLP